jgi:DNA-binding response OmpR family regulator
MNDYTILFIEDDERFRKFTSSALEKEGFKVIQASTGKAALLELKSSLMDLVLLDLRLPDMDGMEILQTVRRQNDSLPIIVVSVLEDINKKVLSFEMGCDDYVVKPFYIEELVSRIQRVLKRANMQERTPLLSSSATFEQGHFVFDLKLCKAEKTGQCLELRRKLFELLLFFAKHPGIVLTKEVLHERVWGADAVLNENTLYVHIRQLRILIEADPSEPRYITTVRKSGFCFYPDGQAGSLS